MPLQIVKLTDPIQFTNVAGGLAPKGAYNAGTDYAVGDSVDYNGSSYVMHTDAAAGTLPTDTTKWQILAEKGDTGAAGADGADSIVPGPAGADGKTILNGIVDPTIEGLDGDFYINTTADTIFGPKTGGAWGTGTSIVGPAGPMPDPGTNGIIVRTALNTDTARTITGTTNQITVTNGDGVAGNPTLSLPQDIHTGASPTFAGATLSGDYSQTSSATAQWSFRGAKQYFTASSFGNSAGMQYGVQATAVDATNANFSIDKLNYQGNFVSNLFNISSSGNVTYYGNQTPNTDSTYTLGTSSLYWKETYTDKLYLNSTATIDGSTAGVMNVNANIDMGWHELYGAWNISAYNTITAGGDVEVTDATKGVILKSPDGTRYRLTIANGGTVTVSAA